MEKWGTGLPNYYHPIAPMVTQDYPQAPMVTQDYPQASLSKYPKLFEGVRPVIFTSNLISYPPFYFIVNKKTSLHCQKTNKLKSTFAHKKDICISVAY